MRKWAQDAESLDELRFTLVNNTRLWLDDLEAEEQVFNTKQQNSEVKSNRKRKRDQYCWNFSNKGFCRFGRQCRFDSTNRSAAISKMAAQDFSTRGLQLSSGRQFTGPGIYPGEVRLPSVRYSHQTAQQSQGKRFNSTGDRQPRSQAYMYVHQQWPVTRSRSSILKAAKMTD